MLIQASRRRPYLLATAIKVVGGSQVWVATGCLGASNQKPTKILTVAAEFVFYLLSGGVNREILVGFWQVGCVFGARLWILLGVW